MRRRMRAASSIDYDAVIQKYAPGRSFADIGCMWKVHGRIAFLAEEAGASAVTAMDITDRTEEFDRTHRERESQVRFVRGDLHDPAIVDEVGVHDVVWSTGVIYHTPHPMHLIHQLRGMTGEYLIVGSATMPEIPGFPQACVFYPGLADRDRGVHASLMPSEAPGVTTRFDRSRYYDNWWFGITPTAMRAMIENAELSVVEEHHDGRLSLMVARA